MTRSARLRVNWRDRGKIVDDIARLQDALHLRMYGNPDDYNEESVWEAEVEAICSDLPAAIGFILCDCTDEQFLWLSEVFDDVMERTMSPDFLTCLLKRAWEIEDGDRRTEMLEDIRTAQAYIDGQACRSADSE